MKKVSSSEIYLIGLYIASAGILHHIRIIYIEKAKQVLDIIEQFHNEVAYLLGKINEQY